MKGKIVKVSPSHFVFMTKGILTHSTEPVENGTTKKYDYVKIKPIDFWDIHEAIYRRESRLKRPRKRKKVWPAKVDEKGKVTLIR